MGTPSFSPALTVILLDHQAMKLCGVVEAGYGSMYVEWVSMLLNMGFNNLKSRYVSTQILTHNQHTYSLIPTFMEGWPRSNEGVLQHSESK